MGSLRRVSADNDPQLARALIACLHEAGAIHWVSPASVLCDESSNVIVPRVIASN